MPLKKDGNESLNPPFSSTKICAWITEAVFALQKNNKGEQKLTVPLVETGWSDDICFLTPQECIKFLSSAHSSVCLPTFKEGYVCFRGLKSLQADFQNKKTLPQGSYRSISFSPLRGWIVLVPFYQIVGRSFSFLQGSGYQGLAGISQQRIFQGGMARRSNAWAAKFQSLMLLGQAAEMAFW